MLLAFLLVVCGAFGVVVGGVVVLVVVVVVVVIVVVVVVVVVVLAVIDSFCCHCQVACLSFLAVVFGGLGAAKMKPTLLVKVKVV